MNDTLVSHIIERCMNIARYTSETYRFLSINAEIDALKTFWEDFSHDSDRNRVLWSNLLQSDRKGFLHHVFENPEGTLNELNSIYDKVRQLKQRSQTITQIHHAILIAFKLEFYLLHPAFETLFQYLKTLSDTPLHEEDSNAHITRLFDSLYQYNLVTLELELLGETLHRLWQENRKLAIQNNYDPLTGVLNRRGLFNAIRYLSHLAQRNRDQIGIMMIDIDNFKGINDSFGHLFGDNVLRYVSDTIKSNIRASDVLGRYGGEEFLIYLSSISSDALHGVGEKIRMAVEAGNPDKGGVTISIGLAQGRFHRDMEKELYLLIQKADEKLLLAKVSGKNSVRV